MIESSGGGEGRRLYNEVISGDFVVVGGGLAGVCAAITAAREGLNVVLVQDRPVLGGNASSEVRMWAVGATSHMSNNNRWAREGGVIDEILVDNLYRNPDGNSLIFDIIVLEKVRAEKRIRVLLNTAVFRAVMSSERSIARVQGFCSQNGTLYDIRAPLFCDASGDGILGFLSGAAYRMGAESRDEFAEGFAPDQAYGELLGHTLYFYSKDTGRPVPFIAPDFALKDITKIPRYRQFKASDQGCALWWIEYGGRLHTIRQSEDIKWELWKIIYGVWDYIKNSGNFPDAETLNLEWVGTIPGKRESRRFEGDYMLTQADVVEQRQHQDAVAYGGWALDLHPADGVYSSETACTQWHSQGVYQIPFRTMYSRNIDNLFLTGRLISASHVAFGSTRVMLTCALNGQAVGMAAAQCLESKQPPRGLLAPDQMRRLQNRLNAAGHYIPGRPIERDDLAATAAVTASSEYALDALPAGEDTADLSCPRALLLPLTAGPAPAVTFLVEVEQDAELVAELCVSAREGNFIPDRMLARSKVSLGKDDTSARFVFDTLMPDGYAFVVLRPAPGVRVRLSDTRVTGVLTVSQTFGDRVAKSAIQSPPADIGIDSFPFWIPERRPGGKLFAATFDPPVRPFGAAAVLKGPDRPAQAANAWLPANDDAAPALTLRWAQAQTVGRIELSFDTDFDHGMESLLIRHPERAIPFCVSSYRLVADNDVELAFVRQNYRTRNVIRLDRPIQTRTLTLEIKQGNGAPPAVFAVRVYDQ
ncbi:FAD-dependent oxidoreductase [Caulobacter sp. BE254]|uniref:FAD-dependent oxidoreductase n=1 Tax=Caulobacter sp. BE254 TaxID=2817720 RepID=UPI0028649C51|nr:FAD-dependent oxidoreductase [Caulobacter sp. BE254]MDR7114364.1 hypothetical protein [Caulobacter sp. BE254]